jgi:hypothetical protein
MATILVKDISLIRRIRKAELENWETAFGAPAIEPSLETEIRRHYYEASTLLRVAFYFGNGPGSLGAKRYYPEPQLN